MSIIIRDRGVMDYEDALDEMRHFTQTRDDTSDDEIWLLEHPPVYTQGQAGKPEHILFTNDIPIVQSDRGGQVTYHGPGQLILYPLLTLKHYKLSIRCLVDLLERSVIELLQQLDINSKNKREAPGVYINDQKVASIGLRVKKGYCYHGLSLNINTNLTPFSAINPCGYQALKMVNIYDYRDDISFDELKQQLVDIVVDKLNHQTNTCKVSEKSS